MAKEDYALELLLNKATSPALHDDDWDAIAAFCDQVNKELEGPQIAIRLLAHKIHSPTEREALSALSTLEACVKNCGRMFHKEIGKFRFLNEIIRALSPKYLGNKTSERVKKRCIELLYSWHTGLAHETKIRDVYKMLKEQHIIKKDPTYMDKTFDPFPAPKPRRADFEDEERAKELSRLLSSKKPRDLEAANKLIKEMVKEDAEKSEKRSRRINELEAISSQVKLLTEMVKHYTPSSSKSDVDMMKELYENLEKQRPKLFRLAGDTEEKETDAMNDILKVNDGVTKAMSLYMDRVQGKADDSGEAEGAARDTSLLDIGFESSGQQPTSSSEPASGASAILQSEFQSLGLSDSTPASSQYSNLGGLFTQVQQQQQWQQQMGRVSLAQAAMSAPGASGVLAYNGMTGGVSQATVVGLARPSANVMLSAPASLHHQSVATSQLGGNAVMQPSIFSATTSASAATVVTSSSAATAAPSALAELEVLGQSLLEKSRSKDFVPPPLGPPPKLSMNELAAVKTVSSQQNNQPALNQPALNQPTPGLNSVLTPMSVSGALPNSGSVSDQAITNNGVQSSLVSSLNTSDSSGFSPLISVPVPTPAPTVELLPLTDVFVPLENIKPAEEVSPVSVYDKHSLKTMLHYSVNRPRPDVLVMVLSTLSTNTKPLKHFVFQAAVPKMMKVKLQPPSSSDLPGYNPILPPTAITQVLLIANPRKEKVRLKFKISYTLGEEAFSDVGDVEDVPVH